MGPTGNSINVIQIHPTLRCNLQCRHCYSSSGPQERGELPIDALEGFLPQIAEQGFNAVGISGGEPLLYRPLPRLLRTARSLGLTTTVTSNGVLLTPKRLDAIAPHLSLLAISIDGTAESHDALRGPRAFERMRERLADVRAAGVPFGLIFTLTLHNLHELAAAAELAVAEGARLLQVHPLEQVGRAREHQLTPPDDIELAYAFMEVARLQRLHGDRLTLQLDVADRPLIEREPCRAFVMPEPDPSVVDELPLAALVSPLVLQEDGALVPIQHGFCPGFTVAHLDRGPLPPQIARWKRERYPRFLQLARDVWSDLRRAPEHLPFTNWYAAVSERSRGRRSLPQWPAGAGVEAPATATAT